MKINYTERIKRDIRRLVKKYRSFDEDIEQVVLRLSANPTEGTSLGKNIYKIRFGISSKGAGKSGGGRLITYIVYPDDTIYLLTVYDKAERATVQLSELRQILADEGL